MAHTDLIDLDIDLDLDLDIGMARETDIAANQIALELDLGLKPSLPAVVGGSVVSGGVAGLPADAAAAMARSKAMSIDISDQLQANMDIGNEQAEALADAIISNVEADKTIALVADTAELTAQNKTIEIFQALGGHEAQVDRAKDARAFEIELEALHEKRVDILDDKHVGNSIIDSVINSFRVFNTEVALQATTVAAAQNQQDIVRATSTTESAARTNALVKKVTNEGTIVANQRKIAASGQSDLYKAILEQNTSNAEILKSMLSISNQEMSNIMKGYDLLNSIESREIQRERFALDLQKFVQDTALKEIAARRAIIGEQREALQLQIEEGTVDVKVKSQLLALERSGIALEREVIALTIDDATLENRIAASIIAREQAATNLDAANLALDREFDPAKETALQAQWSAAVVAAERAEFEFDELKETADLRLAVKTGALAAQELNVEILGVNARAALLLEEGRTTEALALLDTARSERLDIAVVKADNAANIQAYQSFIFGAHAVEDTAVINSQLDSGNTFYALMRQLGSARGPNGEFILGTTPAKANANLALMEQHGAISNDITGVKILREVRSILQRKHEENPQSIPVDETAAAIEFNATARKYMEDKGAEIVFGDATNPLQPPTIPQLTALSPTLAAQPLFSKVLIPEGNEDANTDSIIAKGLVAMQAGTISQEEVVEGIVAMGNTIGLNNNINHHGMATVGLPYMTSVNMRVMRPRGFTASILDTIQSSKAVSFIAPVGVGLITGAGILATPISGGVSIPVALALSAGVTATAAIALQESSDFTTLDIADPVAVRQHLISILSSSTLGGADTEDVLEAAEEDK